MPELFPGWKQIEGYKKTKTKKLILRLISDVKEIQNEHHRKI